MQRNIKDILQSYYLATHYDPAWYKAWHTWAMANFEVVGFLEDQQFNKINDVPGNELAAHIVSAVTGEYMSVWTIIGVQLANRFLPIYILEERERTAGYAPSTHAVVQVRRS